jgi:hypothetical protein
MRVFREMTHRMSPSRLTFRARVYLQRVGARSGSYLGEKQLRQRPARNAHVTFSHDGRLETGRVELIAPDDWEKDGLVPTVLVI